LAYLKSGTQKECDVEDWEGEHDEDENCNIWVRKAIGVQMIETLDKELIPDYKRGQTLKCNKQSIDHLDISTHLTDDE
jgi:hypothetical protein